MLNIGCQQASGSRKFIARAQPRALSLSVRPEVWLRLQDVDPRVGLPKMRAAWVERRRAAGDAVVTQMHYARAGVVTEEMAFVAAREELDPEFVRSEVPPQAYPSRAG